LITGQEAVLSKVRALAQRGLNYKDEPQEHDTPIIDSAYVTLPFRNTNGCKWSSTIGCLELCMFSEGSRHQEEIIVTGTKVSFFFRIFIHIFRGSSSNILYFVFPLSGSIGGILARK
jgi:hypothetical protein